MLLFLVFFLFDLVWPVGGSKTSLYVSFSDCLFLCDLVAFDRCACVRLGTEARLTNLMHVGSPGSPGAAEPQFRAAGCVGHAECHPAGEVFNMHSQRPAAK